MKRILTGICFLFMFVFNNTAQQTIFYNYDKAGNRVLRSITLNQSQSLKEIIKDTSLKAENPIPEVFKDSIDDKKILIYPNPTKGNLTIEIIGYEQDANSYIYLFNLSGNMLKSEPITGSSMEVDLSNYPVGLYIIEIKLVGKSSVWKIIKD